MNTDATEEVSDSLVVRVFRKFIGIGRYSKDTHQRATRGSILVLGSRILIKTLQFSRTIVVARLLFPEDIGLFALAAAVLGIADMLAQPGIATALVQKEVIDRRHLDTAWTSLIVRGGLVGVITFIMAPFVAPVFGTDVIIPIIQILSIAMMINGFENIGTVLLIRDMQFNRKILYDISLIVAETTVVIVAAFILHSVWALVLGAVANRITSVAVSYIVHPYRPRLTFDRVAFAELFSFGKWVGVGGVIAYFIAQGDTLATGRLLGTAAVGYYALAFGLALLPAVEIGRTLGTVLFPHLSRLTQGERGPLFLAIVRSVFLVSIPASIGLAMISEPLVRIVYGEKWLPMLPILHVLLVYGGIKTLSYLIEPLYLSMARPRAIMAASSVHLIVMMGLMAPFAWTFGVRGVALAVLAGAVTSLIYLLYGVRQGSDIRLRALLSAAVLPLIAGSIMAVALITYSIFIPIISPSLLISEVLVGMLVYGLTVYAIDAVTGGRVRQSIVWLKRNL